MKISRILLFAAFMALAVPVFAQEISGNFAGGSIKIGDDTVACGVGRYGAIRYNTNKFQGCSTGGWVDIGTFGGGAGATALSALTDATITSAANNDILRYDGSTSRWRNVPIGTAMTTTSMVAGFPDAIICNVTNPAWGPSVFYLRHAPTGSLYFYRTFDATTDYAVAFNSTGAFSSYQSLTTTDCNVSIASLYGSGKAFNFIGGSGPTAWSVLTGVPAGFADGVDDVGSIPALPSSQIFVGNAGGVAPAVALSGDATISNAGVLNIANNAIIGPEISDSSINSARIADGAVASADIADGTITGTDIANTTIPVGKISTTAGTPGATTYLRGDGTWAAVGGADNLGNHTATTTLALGAHAITSSAGTVIDGGGGWHRTYGNAGWFNGTHGGGWNMEDTTWLRAYGGKAIYTTNVVRADSGIRTNQICDINGANCRAQSALGGGGGLTACRSCFYSLTPALQGGAYAWYCTAYSNGNSWQQSDQFGDGDYAIGHIAIQCY